ncbi:amidohydrolase [Virgibacillus sp. Bac330]|uniref:amidohydrolase n=1 Tax=Virgibacillus sp. Bac330 TaxID=2419841 RepID=UPI000EF4B7DB|nr:amidohydrolase [Virgibacillus sp. Bac330]
MMSDQKIFINGNILTMDETNTIASSIAIKNGTIIGIWEEKQPPLEVITATDTVETIDLAGKTMLPGFIDTHNHILMYGLFYDQVNCSTPPNASIPDILKRIENKVASTPEGEWIIGFGYDDTLLTENRHPTRNDLDTVSPNHPVLIRHISGHLAVANSLALFHANVDDNVAQPIGGHFGKDENGKLDGVLYEPAAIEPIQQKIPENTIDEMVKALENAAKEYIAQGITTNTDAKVDNLPQLQAHLKAAKLQRNPMRTQLMIMHQLLREDGPFHHYSPEDLNKLIQNGSNGLARLDSIKMFQDGSIQGLTGALREPYYKHPNIYGDLIHEQASFEEDVLALHQRGYRITTHGNGDKAIGSILDAYENALNVHPKERHQHRIEHVQTATPDDIKRMQKLQVAGSFFINHVFYWGDRHEKIFLGPERARRINPLAEAKENDLLYTLHSDCPITPISPLFSIWAAVTRKTRAGKTLGAEQRIDVITAIKAMTIYGAKLIFDEENTGSIEIGKKADFAILNDDPLTIEPEKIKDIEVVATIINGEKVFDKTSVTLS